MLERIRDSFAPDDNRAEALLDECCGYISRVHGVHGGAQYTYYYTELAVGVNGRHLQSNFVVVSTRAAFPVLASVHEIGHALDAVFLNSIQINRPPDDPPLEFASDMAEATQDSAGQEGTLLCPWLAAVRRSTHWKNLVAVLNEPSISKGQAEQIKKLLNVRELWARSYELYISRRDSERGIGTQMDVECRDSALIGSVLVHNYWQGEDFDSIAAECDTIFRRLGWLTT